MRTPLLKPTLFVVLALSAWIAVGPIVGTTAAMLGTSHVPVWAFGAAFSILLLAITVVMLRFDGVGLAALGLVPTRRRAGELAFGFLVGAVLFAALALVRGATVGAAWTFAGWDVVPAACAGLAVALLLLFPEELLFRGYAFQRMATAAGARPAIAISALFFGLYHVVGSGMWGIGAFFQFAMPALGGLVFGWAAVRTKGLALPIGLHLGGNWIQASVMSFQPQVGRSSGAPFTAHITDTQLQVLYAPDFSAHVPYIVAMIGAAAAVHAISRQGNSLRAS